MAATLLLALTMVGVTLVPVSDGIAESEPVQTAAAVMGAIVPDFVEDALATSSAGALSLSTGWTHATLYMDTGDMNWLLGLGYAGATSVVCGILASTLIGGVICAGVFYIIWSIMVRYRGTMDWTYCRAIRIRPWGSVSTWVENRTC